MYNIFTQIYVTFQSVPPTQSKPQALAIKRKAESEEEREDCSAPSLQAVRSSPVAESPKITEDKVGLGGEESRATFFIVVFMVHTQEFSAIH